MCHQLPLLLHQLLAERYPPLTTLMRERYGDPARIEREAPPPTHGPWPVPHLQDIWRENHPLTLALLQEAYPLAAAEWLHKDLHRAPLPGTSSQASSTPPRPAPQTTDAARRHRRAIDRNRIWATTDAPISWEAKVEANAIITVLCDRRRRASWQGQPAFEGWHIESQELIAAALPTRRHLLQAYSDRRHLIRRKRRTWKLAEHIVTLDATLDRFPAEGGIHGPS